MTSELGAVLADTSGRYDRAGDFVALVRGRYLSLFIDLIEEAISVALFAFFGGHVSDAYEPLERAVLDPLTTMQRVELLKQIVAHDKLDASASAFFDGIGSAIECRDLFAHWSISYDAERSPAWEFILHHTRKTERRRFGATDAEIEGAFDHLIEMNAELMTVVTGICVHRGASPNGVSTP
jgi:hypothetical protein